MKTLEKEMVFGCDGLKNNRFVQVKRQGDVCIYQRFSEDGKPFGFEVFKVKVVKAGAKLPGGELVEEDYERYPSANDFGRSAKFVGNLEAAEHCFGVMTGEIKDEVTPEPVKTPIGEKVKPVRSFKKTAAPKNGYLIPSGEFNQRDFAKVNGLPERGTVYNIIQSLIGNQIKVAGKKQLHGKGRATTFFLKL
jgi:hypothetical protein